MRGETLFPKERLVGTEGVARASRAALVGEWLWWANEGSPAGGDREGEEERKMRNIMTRALAASLLLGGLVGAQGPARAALTNAGCVVSNGSVVNYTAPPEDGGVPLYLNSRPKVDYYVFQDHTNLTCSGNIGGQNIVNKNFGVTAGGWSTGITSNAGETCDEGKSLGAGSLVATGPAILYANVSFKRVESMVWAYGPMYSDEEKTNHVANFNAQLSFVPWKAGATGPDLDAFVGCTGEDDSKGANRARMDGVAQITDVSVPMVQP